MTVMEFQNLKPGITVFIKHPNDEQDVMEHYLLKVNSAKRKSEHGPWKVRGAFVYFQEDEDDPSRFGWDVYTGADIELQGVHIDVASKTVPDMFKKTLIRRIIEKG